MKSEMNEDNKCVKSFCRVDIIGRVSSMCYNTETSSCLVSTIANGAHVFHVNAKCHNAQHSTQFSTSDIETYSCKVIGDEANLSSCFIRHGEAIALGSFSGNITLISRHSRGVLGSCFAPHTIFANDNDNGNDDNNERYCDNNNNNNIRNKNNYNYNYNNNNSEELCHSSISNSLNAIRSLHTMYEPDFTSPSSSSSLLACSARGASIIDLECTSNIINLYTPVNRAVSAQSLSFNLVAVANYDGKVLIYDIRQGIRPINILSIPDQITTLTTCPCKEDNIDKDSIHNVNNNNNSSSSNSHTQVAVGTVAGRIFTLRCMPSNTREQAFGTGTWRSPIASLSIRGTRLAAGDLSGRLIVLDTAESLSSHTTTTY